MVIQHLVPWFITLVNFICIYAVICYGLDLGKLIQQYNQLIWHVHNYRSTLAQSTTTCVPYLVMGVPPFLFFRRFGWLGGLGVFLTQYLDCWSINSSPWASHSPLLNHPWMTWINNFPSTLFSCPHLGSWPFELSWSFFGGPPSGDWGQFWPFHMYTQIWLPKPHEMIEMYYKPNLNTFVGSSIISSFCSHCVCTLFLFEAFLLVFASNLICESVLGC